MKTWTFSCVMTLSIACVPVDQVYAAIRRDESTNLVQQLFTLRLVIHFHRLHLSGCLLFSLLDPRGGHRNAGLLDDAFQDHTTSSRTQA